MRLRTVNTRVKRRWPSNFHRLLGACDLLSVNFRRFVQVVVRVGQWMMDGWWFLITSATGISAAGFGARRRACSWWWVDWISALHPLGAPDSVSGSRHSRGRHVAGAVPDPGSRPQVCQAQHPRPKDDKNDAATDNNDVDAASNDNDGDLNHDNTRLIMLHRACS